MLKNWRKREGLTMEAAAAVLGLRSASQVFYIEKGLTFPSPESIALIEGATRGEITVADHWAAWRKQHPTEFHKFRAAGRSAAKEHRPPPAKPKSKRRA